MANRVFIHILTSIPITWAPCINNPSVLVCISTQQLFIMKHFLNHFGIHDKRPILCLFIVNIRTSAWLPTGVMLCQLLIYEKCTCCCRHKIFHRKIFVKVNFISPDGCWQYANLFHFCLEICTPNHFLSKTTMRQELASAPGL